MSALKFYRTLPSVLSGISAVPRVPLFMDSVDLQLLQTRCVMIQPAMNRSRRVSLVLTLMAVLLTQLCSVLERSFRFETCLVGCGSFAI